MQQLLAFTRTGNHTLHHPIHGSLILQSLTISLWPQVKHQYLLRSEAIILLKKKGSAQEVQKVIRNPDYYTLEHIARRIFSASNGQGTLISEIASGGKIELVMNDLLRCLFEIIPQATWSLNFKMKKVKILLTQPSRFIWNC